MIPAAPLVGAVTTRPPAAFSSLTARANSVTQSIACSGSGVPASASRPRRSSAARRRTFNPPGSTPSRSQPRSTHSRITRQISSRPARMSASLRQERSLASITSLIDSPVRVVTVEQLRPGQERVPHHSAVRLDPVRAGRRLVHHEPATDGVVGAAAQLGAGPVVRREGHPVRVVRQRPAAVQRQIPIRVEVDLVRVEDVDPPLGPDPLDPRTDGVRVDSLRRLAGQPEQHRRAAAVAVPGGTQRAEQLGLHPRESLSSPSAFSPPTNVRAARIGPTVCELDGPIPTLKRSKTLIMAALPRRRPGVRDPAGS